VRDSSAKAVRAGTGCREGYALLEEETSRSDPHDSWYVGEIKFAPADELPNSLHLMIINNSKGPIESSSF
jgi:hypothetical protein